MANAEKKQLLHQLMQGSQTAFETLYQEYYARLYLHAYQKLRDRELAKDVVQDLFTVLWQKREELHIEGNLSSYLHAAVRNRVLDVLAKEQSKVKYLDTLSLEYPIAAEYTDSLLRERMMQEQIDRVLAQLPPRVREIFELSRTHYLTHKQIAAQLNISEHTVRGYVKEALKTFRSKLAGLLWVLFLMFIKLF